YRAYAMAPLNSLEFSADEGIREGRQKGSRANVRNVAYTGRLEYLGVRGLVLGRCGSAIRRPIPKTSAIR
ncbi:MAG: hypothetical protein DMF98_13710, partial [Acidobacteria bacterium]